MFISIKDKNGSSAAVNTDQVSAVIRRDNNIGETWQVYTTASRIDTTPQDAQRVIDAAPLLVQFVDALGCRLGVVRDAIAGIFRQPPHMGRPERWVIATHDHWVRVTAEEADRLMRLLTGAEA